MMSAQGNLYAWPPSPSPLSSRDFQNLSSSQADINPHPLNLELIPLQSDLDDAIETSPDRQPNKPQEKDYISSKA